MACFFGVVLVLSLLLALLIDFTPFPSVSVVDLEQVNTCWV